MAQQERSYMSKGMTISIFSCLFALVAVQESYAVNILTNGDFELGNVNNWTVFNSSGQPYTFGVTSETSKVHSGSYAGCISSYQGNSLFLAYNSGSVTSLAVGSMIKGRIYVKTENLTFKDPAGAVSVLLVGWDASGAVVTYNTSMASFTGTNPYTPIDVVTQIAPKVVRADIHIHMTSAIATGAIYFDDASIEPFNSPGAIRSDIPDCKLVKDSKGTPRLSMNGVIREPSFFFGPNGNYLVMDEMAKAAKANVNLIQIIMDVPWNGMSNGILEQVLKANPNAMICPWLNIGPPKAWIDAHPDQIMKTESNAVSPSGNSPSLASDLFFNDFKDQLDIYIRYIHNSPYKDKIMGYILLYGEWFYPDTHLYYFDYSEVNRQKFSQWAQGKYGTIGALNSAWNKSYGSFNDVQIPPSGGTRSGRRWFFPQSLHPSRGG